MKMHMKQIIMDIREKVEGIKTNHYFTIKKLKTSCKIINSSCKMSMN